MTQVSLFETCEGRGETFTSEVIKEKLNDLRDTYNYVELTDALTAFRACDASLIFASVGVDGYGKRLWPRNAYLQFEAVYNAFEKHRPLDLMWLFSQFLSTARGKEREILLQAQSDLVVTAGWESQFARALGFGAFNGEDFRGPQGKKVREALARHREDLTTVCKNTLLRHAVNALDSSSPNFFPAVVWFFPGGKFYPEDDYNTEPGWYVLEYYHYDITFHRKRYLDALESEIARRYRWAKGLAR